MDASSGAPAGGVNDARRLVRDAARPLPPRARAGVVRPDRRRHLRLPRDPDRPAGMPVPRAEPHRRALDRRRRRRPAQVLADPHWLPFPENSLDLIVLPHALEFSARAASAAARGLSHDAPGRPDRDRRLQSVLAVRRAAAISAAARRRRGTAASSRSTGSRTGSRCSASRSPAAGSTATCRRSRSEKWLCALRASSRRAGDRWWPIAGGVYYLRATKTRARHARDHAGVGAAQERPRDGAAAGARVHRAGQRDRETPRAGRPTVSGAVTIYTDGACKGNPGPGGWGALLIFGDREKELFGGEPRDHQQPDGADRRHPRAREPEARVRRRSLHRFAVREERHRELDPRLEDERLEDRRPEARQERGPVARARRARRAARASAGTGSRATRTIPATCAPTRSPIAAWPACVSVDQRA